MDKDLSCLYLLNGIEFLNLTFNKPWSCVGIESMKPGIIARLEQSKM